MKAACATRASACGVIITPTDITDYVPVAVAKDSDMACTQFDNAVAEDAGLLKMDFLGLKTLTIIKDAVRNVKDRHGLDLDPDSFPLDDTKTYELFQRGETIGIFQYESAGMQKYLKDLKPTVFERPHCDERLVPPGAARVHPFVCQAEARAGAHHVRPRRVRRIPRGDLRNHRVPGAGNAVVAEVGRLHQGRGGYAAEGDGQEEGGPHCQNEAAVPRARR